MTKCFDQVWKKTRNGPVLLEKTKVIMAECFLMRFWEKKSSWEDVRQIPPLIGTVAQKHLLLSHLTRDGNKEPTYETILEKSHYVSVHALLHSGRQGRPPDKGEALAFLCSPEVPCNRTHLKKRSTLYTCRLQMAWRPIPHCVMASL